MPGCLRQKTKSVWCLAMIATVLIYVKCVDLVAESIHRCIFIPVLVEVPGNRTLLELQMHIVTVVELPTWP